MNSEFKQTDTQKDSLKFCKYTRLGADARRSILTMRADRMWLSEWEMAVHGCP